jgi:hypothetical protein
MDLNCGTLKRFQIRDPLRNGEALLCAASTHDHSCLLLGGECILDCSFELMEEMGRGCGFDRKPPTGLIQEN